MKEKIKNKTLNKWLEENTDWEKVEPQIFLDGTHGSDNPRAIELVDTYNYAMRRKFILRYIYVSESQDEIWQLLQDTPFFKEILKQKVVEVEKSGGCKTIVILSSKKEKNA